MKRKHIIKISILLVFGIAIVIGISLIYRQINQPAVATLTEGQAIKSQTPSYNIGLTPKLVSGKYVSFDYPTGLTSKPGQLAGPIVEDFVFNARDIGYWTLAIEISKLSGGDLMNNSSYTLRKNMPPQYSESHVVAKGQSVDIMTDTTADGFNEVAFIIHNNLLATVALSGKDAVGTQPLQTTLNMVLNSLHWLE